MAGGRLSSCLIPPYSGVEIYSNTSGSSASISISAQVIHPSADSEITTTVGTSSTTLSGITTITSTGCYCRLTGYHLDNNGYYGAYTASTDGESCGHVNRYIKSDGTCTVGFSTTITCCMAFGGSEVVNPLLRYGTGSVAQIECCPGHSAVLGFTPALCCTCGSGWFALTKYNTPSEQCAAISLINACCSAYYGGGQATICCNEGFYGAINYYALENITPASTYCFCTDRYDAISVQALRQCILFNNLCGNSCLNCNIVIGETTGYICYWCNSCSNWNSSLSLLQGYNGTSTSCNCTCLWYYNASGCKISPYGVQSAATKGVFIHEHYIQGPVRYFISSTNFCFICNCLCQFSRAVDIFITPTSSNCELPVKYLSYNPGADCVYMMVRSTKARECGIFSVDVSRLCACYNQPRTTTLCAENNVICVTMETTPLFCKVADFPEIMTCSYYTSPFMCVSCLFRSGESAWSISIYNCDTTAWDTFASSNLVDWESSITSFSYVENDTSMVKNNISCVYRQCNCFMSNIDCSGMIDYKVSANNYERTGVVISNGDKVFVNNNSNKCMSAQVWGYEG